jgi:YVTN family beta-propeller protein
MSKDSGKGQVASGKWRVARWASARAVVLTMVLALSAGLTWRRPLASASPLPDHVLENANLRYLSPVDLKLSPDGQRLYVVCEDIDSVLAVNTSTGQVVARVRVGDKPKSMAISPNGKTLYVTNERSGSVTAIDTASFEARRTIQAGWGPAGITTDGDAKFLYVANTLGGDVSVIDIATGQEIKRLDAGQFPEYVLLSRDGKRVYVSNILARLHRYDQPPVSELAAIDTRAQVVAERISVPGVIELRHLAEVPAGAGGYLLVPFLRPKNLNTLIQIPQGWFLTHGMAIIRPTHAGLAGQHKPGVAEVLLDDIDHYYADGLGTATTPDGRWALVTASGANVVSVLDIAKLNRLLLRTPQTDPEALANRLDSARQFVVRRLATGRNPTAVAVSPSGQFAYIANRMDDTVSVVDLRQLRVVSTIDLGGPKEMTTVRRGQRLFYDASYSFQGQMSCASCHPHGGLSDGLAWSLETPQLGRDVVENRTQFSIAGTSPFKWNGKNPNLETQDGPRTAMFIFRSEGFSPAEVKDLTTFILSLRLPPNPRRTADGNLTDAQARGKAIFFRTTMNTGALIPPPQRCYFCHPPLTHYTARVSMDVGTATPYDTIREFDIPQIEGVYMRPPYLHNGMALSLEEIWTKFNPEDKHGITSDMDKVQLNNLIEYLKTF